MSLESHPLQAQGVMSAIELEQEAALNALQVFQLYEHKDRSRPADILTTVRQNVSEGVTFTVRSTRYNPTGFNFTVEAGVMQRELELGLYFDVGDQIRVQRPEITDEFRYGLILELAAQKDFGVAFAVMTAARADINQQAIATFFPGQEQIVDILYTQLRGQGVYESQKHHHAIANAMQQGILPIATAKQPAYQLFPFQQLVVPQVTLHTASELVTKLIEQTGNRFDFSREHKKLASINGLALTSVKSASWRNVPRETSQLLRETPLETVALLRGYARENVIRY